MPTSPTFEQFPPLPVRELLPALLSRLEGVSSLLLTSPPGSGKTTLIPLALREASWLNGKKVLLQEPRRLAAKMVAHRMAALLGERPGHTVGWRMRGDSNCSHHTAIEVVTDGVLLRLLQEDPTLEPYGAVILDEFHERSLNGDLALMMAAESQQLFRPDLRLIALSATPDVEALRRVLPHLDEMTSSGTLHPVSIHYRPLHPHRPLEEEAARAVLHLLRESDKSILLFLPGAAEILRTVERLQEQLPPGVALRPLYGQLSLAQQEEAIRPAPKGERKVVLSTSIAESSLTIEGVGVVIDAGLERVALFDEQRRIERLITRRLSSDSAKQRSGRAGRQGAGISIRLWSESEPLRPQREPEIGRADLLKVVLELALWGSTEHHHYRWPTSPSAERWERARRELQKWGALDGAGGLTPRGKEMAALPMAPERALFLLRSSELGAATQAARMAALLEEGFSRNSQQSDLTFELKQWSQIAAKGERGARLQKLSHQWLRQLPSDRPSALPISWGLLAALANPHGVAQERRDSRGRYLLASGRGGFLPEGDSLRGSRWLVALELVGGGTDSRIVAALPFDPQELQQLPDELQSLYNREEREVIWSGEKAATVGKKRRFWGELLLGEETIGTVLDNEAAEAWGAHLRREGIAALPWGPAAQRLLSRTRHARMGAPNRWPTWDDQPLINAILELHPTPITQPATLQTLLTELLGWDKLQELNRLYPEKWSSLSGNSYTIDYQAEPATLSAPLQEFFGQTSHPVIGHKTPLRLQLLSPANRPIQATDNLEGFWRGSYLEVRKEMRGRYPKHNWPLEPWNELPHRGPKRKRPT